MKLFLKALVLLLSVIGFSALAQTATSEAPGSPPRQNLAALQQVAEQFLQIQTTGLSGTVNATVEPVDSRIHCTAQTGCLDFDELFGDLLQGCQILPWR